MARLATRYSARFDLPDILERNDIDQIIKCRTRLDGAAAEPTSGTVSVYRADGTAVVDGQAVTVSGSVAQYTITAATLASESLGWEWRVEWTLVMPDAASHVFRNDAALVRMRLYPMISDADLFRRVAALDPSAPASITTETNYQTWIDEADVVVQGRLLQDSKRPGLIMQPSALREVFVTLTLALIMENLAGMLDESFGARAFDYRKQYEAAWSRMRFSYDETDSGLSDGKVKRSGRSGTLWLNGRY